MVPIMSLGGLMVPTGGINGANHTLGGLMVPTGGINGANHVSGRSNGTNWWNQWCQSCLWEV